MVNTHLFCTSCGREFPQEGLPYICPVCGGIYDFRDPFPFKPEKIDHSSNGIWRFHHTFNLPPDSGPVSLGEGNTPLIWVDYLKRQIAFKCEYLNPTGSFKDRGSSVMAAWLKNRGIREAAEDSSGNAGASFAAYAARLGIKARVFVPASASGPKRRQIEAYGAELVPVEGTRSQVTDAVRREADNGVVYASHAYLPFNIVGYATIAYEIVEQLGRVPGTVVVPVGQGGLLLGIWRGFIAMRIANAVPSFPMLVGVQARAIAPIWYIFEKGNGRSHPQEEKSTLAEGVCVSKPIRGNAIQEAISSSNGFVDVTSENDILPARDELARLGFYVEPTSAIVWPVGKRNLERLAEPVVVILTGSGLKYG